LQQTPRRTASSRRPASTSSCRSRSLPRAKASGGFELLARVDLSGEAKASRESLHTIELSMSVADKDGKPIKVRSDTLPPASPVSLPTR
jgi:hypothetical protein